MNEEKVIENLKAEGFDSIYAYTAEPNEIDEEHTHDFDTKLVILEGRIQILMEEGGVIVNTSYPAGSEIFIPRNKTHSAKVAAEGCKYIVAEKH